MSWATLAASNPKAKPTFVWEVGGNGPLFPSPRSSKGGLTAESGRDPGRAALFKDGLAQRGEKPVGCPDPGSCQPSERMASHRQKEHNSNPSGGTCRPAKCSSARKGQI